MADTMWGERTPGQQVVEVRAGEETALLFGDFDRARLPPELGGEERVVVARGSARCPHPGHDHVVRVLDMGEGCPCAAQQPGDRIVVFECRLGGWAFCQCSSAWWSENVADHDSIAASPFGWRMQ